MTVEPAKLVQSDARARPRPFSFRPPKDNALVIALCNGILRLSLRRKLKVTDVDISAADLERLRALRGKRCLVTPSHSGGFEPYVVMYIGKLLGDHFNYLATLEAFEKSPLTGWLMQRLGAYSIIRGATDRPSFQTTKRLLVEGKRWLVIFPEGQTTWQNSAILRFQPGVFQIAFRALEEAAKEEDDPSLYCVPIAVKYVYLEDMHEEIDASLERLERAVFTDEKLAPLPRYDRLRRVGEAVLVANEKKYGVEPETEHTFDERIQTMKEHIVERVERRLELKPSGGQPLLDRIHAVFHAVDRIVFEDPDVSEYERRLLEERQREVRSLYDDLFRVLQFVAIHDGYVSQSLTVDRFLDVLCLLEMEVFQQRRIWGPRKARVSVGELVDLRDHLSTYRTDRRSAVREVSEALESSVRGLLDALSTEVRVVDTDRTGVPVS